MAHRTKGRLDGVGRAQMPPMGGGKGIEGKQRLFILAEAGTGFGVFGLVEGDKSCGGYLMILAVCHVGYHLIR